MKRKGWLLGLCLIWFCACSPTPISGPEKVTVTGPEQSIDRRYQWGRGPRSNFEVLLLKSYPEPVWLTGVELRVLTSENKELGPEQIDWAALSFVYPVEHQKRFYPHFAPQGPLFRLGSKLNEVELPSGQGLPMWSHEPLQVTVRWKNEDNYFPATKLKAEVTCHFVRDRALQEPLQAVLVHSLVAAAPLGNSSVFGAPAETQSKVTPPKGMSMEYQAPLVDALGGKFSEEWSLVKGVSTSQFDLSGQVSKLPKTTPILLTTYSSSAVDELRVQGVGDVLELSPMGSVTSGLAVLQPMNALVLTTEQSAQSEQERALCQLLLYLPNPSFKEFPEKLR